MVITDYTKDLDSIFEHYEELYPIGYTLVKGQQYLGSGALDALIVQQLLELKKLERKPGADSNATYTNGKESYYAEV